MGAENHFTTAYRPQTNGLTERLNKTLADMLSMYVNTPQTDWDEYLPQVTFAYNTARQESTKITPFELLYGRLAILPTEAQLAEPIETEFVIKTKEQITVIREQAKANIISQQVKDKRRYDGKHRHIEYQVGQKVKVYNPERHVGKTDKLLLKWFGPYEVIERKSDVNYVIKK